MSVNFEKLINVDLLSQFLNKIKTIIPTKTSDLTNDSGFVNASGATNAAPVQSVNGQTGAVSLSIPSAATATPVMNGTATVGSSAKYAKEDHVHPTDTSRLAANQGSGNAGKFLMVGNDGIVAPVTMATWQGGSY